MESITINTPDGRKLIFRLDFAVSILHDLKCTIEDLIRIVLSKQKLIYNSKELTRNTETLFNLGIKSGANLYLIINKHDEDFVLFYEKIFDPYYDFDLTNIVDRNKKFLRGGKECRRPCGWKRIALKVTGKYEDDI